MKVFHFDVGEKQQDFKRFSGHKYFDCTVNDYIEKEGPFAADIVTGFPTSNFSSETLDSIKGLKLVLTRSLGFDNINREHCDFRNIKYLNVQYSRYNVAHHTLAFLLFYSRKFDDSFRRTKSGDFCHEDIDCLDLKVRTFGLIGYGKIGKEVAELVCALGMKVIAYDRKYRYGDFIDGFEMYDFNDLIEIADVISIHCDANPTNVDLINEKTINKMKDGVAIINTARGSLINEKDLIKNIEKFSFVGLDVLNNESKFNQDNPLLKYPNVFITPHTAYKSEITTKERWDQTYQNIENFIEDFTS